MSSLSNFILRDFSKINANSLKGLKRLWAKELKVTPKDSDILRSYRELLSKDLIKENFALSSLMTRSIRTESGVTPFAVMTKPYVCPGLCTFCPLELGMPKSYLSDEPAAARAKQMNFDPKAQIESRLKQLVDTGHLTDKIELIVIGGTFGNYPKEYKKSFFKDMIDTVNGFVSESLEEAQVSNESAVRRIVGISVETRPDWIDETEVKLFRQLGVTKVQVGVQAFDEKILKQIKRGHTLDRVGEATELLKNAGIKVCYHFMPNLPGSSPELDVAMAHIMYEDIRFKPDFLKVYPAQVIEGTEMFRQWERGEYKPYPDNLMKEVLKDIKRITPRYVRIDRLVRDISKKWVSAGTKNTNMRADIQKELALEGFKCQCIRCREVRRSDESINPTLCKMEIETKGGKEFLLTFENQDILFSLLRLRLPINKVALFPELNQAAIIREVHTYGRTVQHNDKNSLHTQHHGLGKKLIAEAEKIALIAGYKKIAVISSIGTRDYYRKLGYLREGFYMCKVLV